MLWKKRRGVQIAARNFKTLNPASRGLFQWTIHGCCGFTPKKRNNSDQNPVVCFIATQLKEKLKIYKSCVLSANSLNYHVGIMNHPVIQI